MEIPERCVGCPNITFYEAYLAELERATKMTIATTEDLMEEIEDKPDYVAEAGSPVGEIMEEIMAHSFERSRQALTSAFDVSDKYQDKLRTTLQDLPANCRKGVKTQRQYRLFGQHIVRCSSKKNRSAGAHTFGPDQELDILD